MGDSSVAITKTITIGTNKSKVRRIREPIFKRKVNPKGKCLVVVESPAKAKTIELSLIHISEPTRLHKVSRMPSSA